MTQSEAEELFRALAACTTQEGGRERVWDAIRASSDAFSGAVERHGLSPNEVAAAAAASAGFNMAACLDLLRESYLDEGEIPPDVTVFRTAFLRLVNRFLVKGLDEIDIQKQQP